MSEDLLEVIQLITVTMGRNEKMNKNAFKCRQTPKGRDLVEYSSKMFL